MKSKKVLSLILAMAMTFGLAACSSGSSGSSDTSEETASEETEEETEEAEETAEEEAVEEETEEAAAEETEETADDGESVTVTVAIWNGDWGDKLDRITEAFNSENPGITIDIQMQTGDYSDYLGTKVASNDLADIYMLTPYKQVEAFAEAGRLVDLSDQPFVDMVYEQALDAVDYDGKIYGYPANYEFLGVFYNKEIFEAAGIEEIPTTRSEFLEVCEQLEAAGYQAIGSQWKESWTLKHLFSVLMTTIVQDDIDGFISDLDSGSGTFDVDGIDEVFAFADIVKEYSGDNMMDQDSTSAYNALANGEVAMILSGEFSQSVMSSVEDAPEVGVFAMPVSEDAELNKLAVDVGVVYVVNNETEHLEECYKVLDYFSDPDDPEGYIAINFEEMGAAVAAMPYESSFEAGYLDDYNVYADAGNTVPWVYQQYVNGFDVISGEIFQSYIAGAADQATVIQELDANYKEYLDS